MLGSWPKMSIELPHSSVWSVTGWWSSCSALKSDLYSSCWIWWRLLFPPVFLLASSSPVKLSFYRNLWGDSVTSCRKWWVTVRSRWFVNTWSCQFPAMDRTDCTSWGADLSPNLTAADPGLLNVRSHGQPLQTKQRRARICANLCQVFDTTVHADLAIRIEPFMGAFSKSPSFSISQSVLFSVWLVQQQMWVIW